MNITDIAREAGASSELGWDPKISDDRRIWAFFDEEVEAFVTAIKAAHLEELKQKQVPLTDKQIDELVGAAFDDYAWRGTTVMSRELARAIEKAHNIGEKE